MSIDRTVNVHVSYVQMKFDELLSDVQYWRVLCVVHVGYGLGEKTVLVSVCFGAQWSVAPTRGQQRESELGVRVQSYFFSPFPHSGDVKFLEAGQGGTDNPLSSPDCLL